MKLKIFPNSLSCDVAGCKNLWTVVSPLDSYFGRRFERKVKLCDKHLAEGNEAYDRADTSRNRGHHKNKPLDDEYEL